MARGIKSGQTRASGELVSETMAKEEGEELGQEMEQELPEEREKKFRTPGFARMRIEWSSDDWMIISQAQAAVEGQLQRQFPDIYQLMYEIYNVVRIPETDEHGNQLVDRTGLAVWKRTPSGVYEEDWTKMTMKQKEKWMFVLTTRMFHWEQQAADLWGEAMFSKAQFEERFAIAFDAPMSGTVDDRRAAGNIDAREERYFAIFKSLLSRKADALVRSMERLSQRLKDSMQ